MTLHSLTGKYWFWFDHRTILFKATFCRGVSKINERRIRTAVKVTVQPYHVGLGVKTLCVYLPCGTPYTSTSQSVRVFLVPGIMMLTKRPAMLPPSQWNVEVLPALIWAMEAHLKFGSGGIFRVTLWS